MAIYIVQGRQERMGQVNTSVKINTPATLFSFSLETPLYVFEPLTSCRDKKLLKDATNELCDSNPSPKSLPPRWGEAPGGSLLSQIAVETDPPHLYMLM